jgi:hypothetical protein
VRVARTILGQMPSRQARYRPASLAVSR